MVDDYLTLAIKAAPIAYGPLVAAHLLRHITVSGPLDIHYKDAATIVNEDPGSSVDVHIKSVGTVVGVRSVMLALLDAFTSDLSAKSPKEEQVKWIEFADSKFKAKAFDGVATDLAELDDYLQMRTTLVGYSVSLADIAVWAAVKSNGVAANTMKRPDAFANASRWFRFIDGQLYVKEAVETLNKQVQLHKKSSAKSGSKKTNANYEIGLQDAVDGQVVTRFPPEPSGYLHIGHAKAALLNDFFAKQYHGTLIVRFDDTNPSKEKEEYQDSILEDLILMGIKPHKVTYSSDYFDYMYNLAIDMIKAGHAYADDTDQPTMRQQRFDGVASARRDQTVEENLAAFKEMYQGSEAGLKWCIRAKISVDDPNKAMRDPVIYRCNPTPHHRSGSKWKVYPTYDFCCPVVDALEGVTHALRTIEYRDRDAQYAWMLEALKLRKVHVWEFSRMNFVRTVLSKRKLQRLVDMGVVSGWDDPRMPTVRGVRRRGMTVEALQQFIISQGPSKNILNLDWSSFWAVNKKIIDPIAPRHTAIDEKDCVKVDIVEGPAEFYQEERPLHKKNKDVGVKKTTFGPRIIIAQEDAQTVSEGEELTLMDWGNAIVKKIHKDGNVVKSLVMHLHLQGDFKKTEKKLTWLADNGSAVTVQISTFDNLITKDKLEEDDKLEDFITPVTEVKATAYADANVTNLKKGDVIQFERRGYYVCDQPFDGETMVFFDVPDGKVVNRYGAKTAAAPAPASNKRVEETHTVTYEMYTKELEPFRTHPQYGLLRAIDNDIRYVQGWLNIELHALDKDVVVLRGTLPPQHGSLPAIVYPRYLDTEITPGQLAEVFEQLEASNLTVHDKRSMEPPGMPEAATIYLAAVAADSTISYYRVSDGLVKPRQHGES